ncbi:phage major capsid protein [Gelria sp. Kuro-4]|uniref:phage major capsid protein n=1 Tax=Gelria sp. Kuro-4 TaxID=2796927 RepID=UPI001BEDF65E|nr:phage major capsid protein [Gelria sp. Kuro-4]BCV23297.1 hypothetical protein kuro4_00700 [Gelria sp. Kuro-4]
MATNVAVYESILKEVYAPAISKEFIKNKPLLEKLEKSAEHAEIGGRYFYVPVALLANQGVGTAGELDTITAPTQTVTAGAKYYSFIQWGVCSLSKRALEASVNADAAWENLKNFEFANIIENIRQNTNRQLYGDSVGILTKCGAATSVNVVPITTPKYIFENMYVDIIDTTNGAALATNRKVVAVNRGASPTMTIDGAAVTTTANHGVVRSGSYNKEWDGLAKIVAPTGAVGGIDPATAGYQNWAAYLDTTGGAVGMPLIQKGFDAIELNGGKVDLAVASYGVYRAMANFMESAKRIPVDGTVKLAGGMSGMTWNGVEVYKDQDCPAGTLYLIDYDALQIGQIGEPGWLDTGGTEGGILHYIPRSFAFEAVYYWDGNLITIHRNRLAGITNITEA